MNNYFYKQSMFWINLLQVIRRGLADMRFELYKTVAENTCMDPEKAGNLLQALESAEREMSETEEIILISLNNGGLFWRGEGNKLYFKGSLHFTDHEMIELMKKNFLSVIELQEEAARLLSLESTT